MLVNQKDNHRKKSHPTRIYLGKCSTYNHMYNKDPLTDMREEKICMFGHCNVVNTSTNKKGHLGSMECWLNKEYITNIFSIPKPEEVGFRITYYSWEGY